MGILGLAVTSGCLAATLLWWPGMPEAATYRLQVASVPERVFMYFVKGRTLPRVEAFLDDTLRSKYVLFRDRQPQLLKSPALGTSMPLRGTDKLRKPNNPWGAMTWNGEVDQLVVFRVRGIQSDHQRLRLVAVERDGVLTRLPMRGVSRSPSQSVPVPEIADGYLTRALEKSTFLAWVEERAVPHQGLSVVVGRHHNRRESDTVYLVIRMPQTDRTFKIILGWRTVKREGAYAIIPGRRN